MREFYTSEWMFRIFGALVPFEYDYSRYLTASSYTYIWYTCPLIQWLLFVIYATTTTNRFLTCVNILGVFKTVWKKQAVCTLDWFLMSNVRRRERLGKIDVKTLLHVYFVRFSQIRPFHGDIRTFTVGYDWKFIGIFISGTRLHCWNFTHFYAMVWKY